MLNRNINILLLLLSSLFVPLSAPAQDLSDVEVTAAWQAWMKNDHQQVEQHFLKALEMDQRNLHAQLGLAMLYDLERN